MFIRSKNIRFFSVFSLLSITVTLLSGCGSDTEDTGFINFYNASANSPKIHLTVDEDINSNDEDEVERTFGAVEYGKTLSNRSLPSQDYYYELAWQDDEDSNLRNDLEIIFEDRLSVRDDEITLVVMSGDLPNQITSVFNVPIIDDDDDYDDDLFNLRFLNVVGNESSLDIYISEHDETFNEAEFVTTATYHTLSENFKFEEDRYKFYIKYTGEEEVIFESEEIPYPYTDQYVLAIRPNVGADASPFVLDNIGNTRVLEYKAQDAEASVRFYNGIQENPLLTSYGGSISLTSDIDEANENLVSGLEKNQFSTSFMAMEGSYRVDIKDGISGNTLLTNQLISLPGNTDRTVFYYLVEEWVDDDNDGDFDENDDGQVDEIEAKIKTISVENSTRKRVSEHEVKMLNLAYSEDFTQATFYFVKSDEIIETASARLITTIGTYKTALLLNNTYEVFAIASIDNTQVILDKLMITLDEESNELYLLLETDAYSPTGFKMSFHDQIYQN